MSPPRRRPCRTRLRVQAQTVTPSGHHAARIPCSTLAIAPHRSPRRRPNRRFCRPARRRRRMCSACGHAGCLSVEPRRLKAGPLLRASITAPARFKRATTGGSSVAIKSFSASMPPVVAPPATSPLMLKLDAHTDMLGRGAHRAPESQLRFAGRPSARSEARIAPWHMSVDLPIARCGAQSDRPGRWALPANPLSSNGNMKLGVAPGANDACTVTASTTHLEKP